MGIYLSPILIYFTGKNVLFTKHTDGILSFWCRDNDISYGRMVSPDSTSFQHYYYHAPPERINYLPNPLNLREVRHYNLNGDPSSLEDVSTAVTSVRVQQGSEYLRRELTVCFGRTNAPSIDEFIKRAFPVFEE